MTPSPSLISLGERLRKARDEKSFTIDQVQKRTHIHSQIILAIENGRCDEVLSPTYVKSFLKKYAEFLGLDPAEILREYMLVKEDHPSERPADRRDEDLSSSAQSGLMARFIYFSIIGLAGIALLAFLVFAGRTIISHLWHGHAPAKRPAQVQDKRAGKTPSFSVKGKAVNPPKSVVQKKPAKPSPKKAFELMIRIKQTTLIKCWKDGTLLFDTVMSPGASETIRASEKVDLYVAKAEAIELIRNGISLGSPGRGIMKRLEITADDIDIKVR
jgi:transcriptional regulator with XRE-family HTH domain